MSQRLASIDIRRYTNLDRRLSRVVYSDIPVTPNSVYVNELMNTEYVKLQWNSDSVLELLAGDFVLYDGINYYIREANRPKQATNGGYTYEQEFVAEWVFWSNWKLFYNKGIGTESGWKMTNFPEYFLQLIINEANRHYRLFSRTQWSYEIQEGYNSTMKLCDFSNSTDIISALNTMCDDEHWGAEWWVDLSNHILHFGECKNTTEYELQESECKTITRNESQNASKKVTKLYAFGGTRNITPYYRRELVFEAGDQSELQKAQAYANSLRYSYGLVDNTRPITSDIVTCWGGESMMNNVSIKWAGTYSEYLIPNTYKTPSSAPTSITQFKFEGISENVFNPDNQNQIFALTGGTLTLTMTSSKTGHGNISVTFALVSSTGDIVSNEITKYIGGETGVELTLNLNDIGSFSVNGVSGNLRLKITASGGGDVKMSDVALIIKNAVGGYKLANNIASPTIVFEDGSRYQAVINPQNLPIGNDNRKILLYNGIRAPRVGEKYKLIDIAEYLLPPSYFQRRTGSVVDGVADNRLLLPQSIDSVEMEGKTSWEEKEGVLVLDDIYPRMNIQVTSVETKQYQEDEPDAQTGLTKTWNAYRVKCSGITFSDKYIIEGETLHIVFQTGDLAGMDFEVQFNPDAQPETSANAQVFEIVRNENYGMPIPNESMKPEEDDTFVLYGFNTGFLNVEAVSNAEQELLTKATEVLQELQNDDSTYEIDCNMVSLYNNLKKDMAIGDQVKLTTNLYGEVESRVRKIEKRLDLLGIKYTIGRSASYSRLRELRKLINNIQ